MPDPDLIFGLTKAMIPETQPPNNQGTSQASRPDDPKNRPDDGKDKGNTASRMANGFANSIERMVEKKLIELLQKLVEPGAFVGATGPVQAGPGLIALMAQKITVLTATAIGENMPSPPPLPTSVPDANRPAPPFPEDIKNSIVNEAVSRSGQQ